jgi:hypothetical protein
MCLPRKRATFSDELVRIGGSCRAQTMMSCTVFRRSRDERLEKPREAWTLQPTARSKRPQQGSAGDEQRNRSVERTRTLSFSSLGGSTNAPEGDVIPSCEQQQQRHECWISAV